MYYNLLIFNFLLNKISFFFSSPHFVPHDVASSSSPGTPQVPRHHPLATGTPPAPPTGTSTTHAQPSSQAQAQAHPSIPRHRLRQHTIPSDMHYSLPTHTLTCSLELPGVLSQHIRVSLATCFFNHVKYVAVSAESVPPFPEPVWGEDVLRGLRGERIWGVVGAGARSVGGEEHDRLKIGQLVNPNMRERRFGILRRMIQVPAYTTVSFPLIYICIFWLGAFRLSFPTLMTSPMIMTFVLFGRLPFLLF